VTIAEKITAALLSWRDVTRAFEGALVDNLAATSPWLAPVIPAWLGWHNMTTVMNFPWWVATVGAIVIEFLGLSTVHTVINLWDYNSTRRQSDQRAPVVVALAAAGGYILVVLITNVLLSIGAPVLHLVAQGLLSLLSVIAAVTLTVRASHARRVGVIEQEKRERKEARKDRKLTGNLPESFRGDWRKLSTPERDALATMTNAEIVTAHGVTERTARTWKAQVAANGYHKESEVKL
jgi:hypothetical protein